jgi:TolB-like protein/Flp pilus assembly protein TadD/predicted Ser/Thr protein kinase
MGESYEVQQGECASDPPTMIRIIRICRKCGAKIFSDAPEGLCSRCVLKIALAMLPEASVAGVADPGGMDKPSRGDAPAAPEAKKAARAVELLGELGDYELLEEVGRGGQGVVFRARQKSLNRIVALKVINLGQWASKAHLKRFRLEAEAAARLEHPGIVPIHEVGERDGSCYFSMKFVEGGQLDEVARREPMPIRRAVELIVKVARTVHFAHHHGILHRDIKPGNILLGAKGEPHLTDFGLARLIESESTVTRTMEVLGTPSYMAPEQAVGNNAAVSSATDVYGLGAVLYQLLTGHPPFAGGTSYETIKLLLDTEPRQPRLLNSKISRDLSTICLKCLEKDPQRRYPSALALAEDIERWLEHEPIQARRTGVFTRGRKWVRRNPTSAFLAVSLIALAAAVGWNIWKSELIRGPVTTGIAVLPFENLSEQKENAAFADGVQDDILTKLAKIADLKVISRTSVMEYRGKRNVRQIGDALRVSHVLEGSARRSGDRIHLNAQLIDTRTDTHVWAEQYDRDLNDLFAIQSEIAEKVAAALKAKLAPEEKARLAARPTANSEAYVLYLTGRGVEGAVNRSDEIEAEQLYMQATALDPGFALAYARASILNSGISGDNRARKAKARAQAEEALRLSPNLGEAHMALGLCLYWGEKKYDAALKEFEVAAATSPNNAEIYTYVGGIYRRQGHWREAIASFECALSLDPRNAHIAFRAANNYLLVRDWPRAITGFNRVLKIAPDSDAKIALAYLEVFRNGSPAAGRNILQNIPHDHDSAGRVALARWDLAMLERDYATAERILTDFPSKYLFNPGDSPKTFYQGRIALARGDIESAQRYFAATAPAIEKWVRDNPDVAEHHAQLGLLYAYMQRKEYAIREGRRAVELEPESQDAFHGALEAGNLALVYALVGEQEQAITLIERLLSIPGPVQALNCPVNITLADLRLRWEWDSLRSNPRFQKILDGPEPKTIY